MICALDESDFCARHQQHHGGPLRAIALGTNERDQALRRQWDANAVKRGVALPVERSAKPKMSINELAAARGRCQQAKAAGLPCTEFGQTPDVWTLARQIQSPPNARWPKGWPTQPATIKAHQMAADAFLTKLDPYPAYRFSGRGVVIVGGGKYWPSVYVAVRMLRHVGCLLPVQVWFLGNAERDDRYAALLSPLGVDCVDALAVPAAAWTRCLTGHQDPGRGGHHPPFELKSFAVLQSPFEEVLSLDADNYPCADPSILFDEPRYKATGGVFWPDLSHTDAWTKWDFFGVAERGPKCGLEVGQYLLNKRQAWRQLNLARWYDDHGDWCYGWGHYGDHGDKGPHRVAWAKLGTDYTMYSTAGCFAKDLAFIQRGPDGQKPMFVHRCRDKFSLEKVVFTSTPQSGFNQRGGFPGEDAAFSFLDELRRLLA